jgi:hypothetical protein
MSRRQFLISILLVWHLVAVTAAVIPASGKVQAPTPVEPDPNNRLAIRLAPLLDAAARGSFASLETLRRVVSPARAITTPYLNVLGFDEYWTMFSNPPKIDQYVRVRYFIRGSGTRRLRTVTELLFPASPEYDVRTLQSFRGSYQDRVVNTMLERYHAEEQNRPSATQESPGGESPYLPLANYFADRFARSRISPGEVIERVEVWHGVAPATPPGAIAQTPPPRLDLLRDYHAGLVDSLGPADPVPLSATEREADIAWTAEFIQVR